MISSDLKIDKTWTLFLDRDGVINLLYPNDYVKSWDEFYFLEGALEGLSILTKKFGRTIIVTNQQGVGKELMSMEDLNFIHSEMLREVRKAGGRIHAIYTATELVKNDKGMRKPDIGMAKQAKKDFPDIDFKKSVMVGDSETDIQFGYRLGMVTVLVGDKTKITDTNRPQINFHFDSLLEFAKAF